MWRNGKPANVHPDEAEDYNQNGGWTYDDDELADTASESEAEGGEGGAAGDSGTSLADAVAEVETVTGEGLTEDETAQAIAILQYIIEQALSTKPLVGVIETALDIDTSGRVINVAWEARLHVA